MQTRIFTLLFLCLSCIALRSYSQSESRKVQLFTDQWRFYLGDTSAASSIAFDDSQWRVLNLPHDWSIEGAFDEKSPSGIGGGALRGGIGWYRKEFSVPATKDKQVFIDFDGVYRNSEVWINGHLLGMRPNGYISFRYDLTPWLFYGKSKNVIAVRVDNSKQPNSRWYSGSGIYRNVWLVTTGKVAIAHWGTHITTPKVSAHRATVNITTTINNFDKDADL